MRHGYKLLRRAWQHWRIDQAPMMAAASAYYLLVTLAPMGLVLLWVGGEYLDAVDTAYLETLTPTMSGEDPISSAETLVEAYASGLSGYGSILALFVAVWAATVFFGNFVRAMDVIFGRDGELPKWWARLLRRRLLAAAALVCVVVVFAATSLAYSLLTAANSVAREALGPGFVPPASIEAAFAVGPWLGLVALSVLFSLAFTYLPARSIRYRDTIPGAVLTACLFMLGQSLLGLYLESSARVSAWGTLSAFVAFIVWVYYSMQAVFFGAEFTRVWLEDRREAAQAR